MDKKHIMERDDKEEWLETDMEFQLMLSTREKSDKEDLELKVTTGTGKASH